MQTSFLSSFFQGIVPLMFHMLFCFTLLLTGELLGNLKHFIILFYFFSDHCIVVFLLKVILNDGVFYQLAVWPQLWNGNSCVAIVSILFQYLCSVEATQSSGRPVWYINEEGKNLQFSFFCASISNASDKWNGLKLNGL